MLKADVHFWAVTVCDENFPEGPGLGSGLSKLAWGLPGAILDPEIEAHTSGPLCAGAP